MCWLVYAWRLVNGLLKGELCKWSYWLQSVMLLTKHNTQLLSLNMMEGLSRISGMEGMLEWLNSHKYYHLPLSKYKLEGLQLWIFINVILKSLSWFWDTWIDSRDSCLPKLVHCVIDNIQENTDYPKICVEIMIADTRISTWFLDPSSGDP